jgi:hypothetical protein
MMTVNIIETSLSKEYLKTRLKVLFVRVVPLEGEAGSDEIFVSEVISFSLFLLSMEGQGFTLAPLLQLKYGGARFYPCPFFQQAELKLTERPHSQAM